MRDRHDRDALARNGVRLHIGEIASLESHDGWLEALVLASGERLARDVLFVHFGEEQAAPFAEALGCRISSSGTVSAGDGERTGVPGLFVAGDTSHDLQLISIAVAEGVRAACTINTELRREAQR